MNKIQNANKIEKLISELCPDGVEFKELWKITNWDKRFNAVDNKKQNKILSFKHVSAKKLKELQIKNWNVKLLATWKFDGWTTKEIASLYLNEWEVITIPTWGSANIKYYNGKFVDSWNLLASSIDNNILNLKYCYYFLLTKNKIIENLFRWSWVKHPSMWEILELQIPIPPIKIQEEIVKILDNFTKLEAELEAELETRKKQYEYYRDEMLNIKDYKVEKLKDITEIYLGLTYTPKYVDEGVKFISAQNTSSDTLDLNNVKYISEEEYKNSTSNAKPKRWDILFTRVGSNLGHPVIVDTDEELCIFVSLGFLRVNKEKVLNSYMKHWMNTDLFWSQVRKNVYGSAKVNLNTGWLKKFEIWLPTIEKQEEIVKILDEFDKLVNDISEGLPAEIEARRQQYEYYRNKLLTFKELKK